MKHRELPPLTQPVARVTMPDGRTLLQGRAYNQHNSVLTRWITQSDARIRRSMA
jgi:hypothetical protein